jgi:hypothetical protein
VDDYAICAVCPHRGRKVRRVSKATGDTWLADCNQRRVCPIAARRYRLHMGKRLAQAEWRLAITLTMPSESRVVTAENIAVQSAAWGKLQRGLKRQQQKPFHWAWVREQKGNDHLHLHVLLDCEFTITELAGLAEKAGFGRQFSVKRISERNGGNGGAIGYVTKSLKYVASHPDFKWPRGTRLIGTSLAKPAKPKGNFEDNFTWIWNPDYDGDDDPLQPP